MSIFMKIVGQIRKWRNWGLNETEIFGRGDWRELATLSQELMPKQELDDLQAEVLEELDKTCASTTVVHESDIIIKPQSLFYCYKYIDAKFDQNIFDFNQRYLARQNILDQKYAEGLGDVELELSEYSRKSQKCFELSQRLNVIVKKLEPTVSLKSEERDKTDELTQIVRTLPREINWRQVKESA